MQRHELINVDLPKSFKIFLALQEEVEKELASSEFSHRDNDEGCNQVSSSVT
jgi:hypothetical protein